MIADLPMYDWPEQRAETDSFWAAVAAELRAVAIEAPERLARPADPAAGWCEPDLLLGQTCGMPFVSGHCGEAVVVARPDYGLAEARDGSYRSVIVVRRDEVAAAGPEALPRWRGRRVAVNEWRSYSGHIALRAHLAGLGQGAGKPFFGAAVLSGSHRASALMVARGAADIAALDGVVWALLGRHEPATAARLAPVGMTAPAPALPYIAGPRHAARAAALAAALDRAAAATSPHPGLPRRVAPASAADYAPIRASARRAAGVAFAPGAAAVPDV